jgi:hypothetical protein
MLTPFVTALVFANSIAASYAVPWAFLTAAFQTVPANKFDKEVLKDRRTKPTGFSGRAGGPGRPTDIAGLRKEELHEFPSAA